MTCYSAFDLGGHCLAHMSPCEYQAPVQLGSDCFSHDIGRFPKFRNDVSSAYVCAIDENYTEPSKSSIM
jgi:hypothetical protein